METVLTIALKEQVDALLEAGQSGEVIKLLGDIAVKHTDDPVFLDYYADVLCLMGFWKEAKQAYGIAFKLNEHHKPYYWKGMFTRLLLREVVPLHEQVTVPDPAYVISDEENIYYAFLNNMHGKYNQALLHLEAIQQKKLFAWQYIYCKADCLYALFRGEEWEYFVKVEALKNKELSFCRLLLADVNAKTGFPVVARLRAEELNRDYPHFIPGLLLNAELSWKEGDIPAAKIFFNKALEKAAWSDEAIGMYAVFNATEGHVVPDWPDLKNMAAQASYPKLAYYLGKIKLGVENDPADAILFFQQAIINLSEFVDARRLLGTAYLQAGDFEKALAAFEAANDITAGLPDILNGIAFASLQLNDHTKAKKYYQFLLQADATHTEAMHALAMLTYEEKDFVTAMDYIRQAIKTDSKEPRHFYMAAQIEAAAGNKQQALRCIHDALKYDPDNKTYESFKKSVI